MSRHTKYYWLFLPSLALLGLISLGCEEQDMGGPDADLAEQEDPPEGAEANTFTATVSDEEFDLAQGEETELTLSIDRGEEFDQVVGIEFSAPAGLMVTPDQTSLRGEDDEMRDDEALLTVGAGPAAQTQTYELELTFTPEEGEAITKVVQVTITPSDVREEALEQREEIEEEAQEDRDIE